MAGAGTTSWPVRIARIVLAAASLGPWTPAAADPEAAVVAISRADPDLALGLTPHVRILRDEAGTLTAHEAWHSPRARPAGRHLNMFGTEGAYWMLVTLDLPAQGGPWVLDLGRPHLIEATLWAARDGPSLEPVWRLPAGTPFAARAQVPSAPGVRPLRTRHLALEMDLPPGRTALALRYRSFAAGWLDPRLGTRAGIAQRRAAQEGAAAFRHGMLVAMIGFALLMHPILTARVSLAFAVYAAVGALFVLQADGDAARLLWPALGLNEEHVAMVLGIAVVAAALDFARALFDTRRTQPRADRLYRGLLAGLAILGAASVPLYGVAPFHAAVYGVLVLTALLHPVIGVRARRARIAGAGAYLAGSPLIVGSLGYAAAAHLLPGRFSIPHTLVVGHVTLVAECFLFGAAALARARGLRAERDAALSAELDAARGRAALTSALTEAERRYAGARRLAERHRAQADRVRHDLRQPLAGMRAALGGADGAMERAHLREALAYMETLTDAPPSAARGGEAEVPLRAIFDGAGAMFAAEARAAGGALHVEPIDALLGARPVPLMRAVSNLVSNAIQHAGAGPITLSARHAGARVLIEVADAGPGIAPEDRARLMRPGEKGAASEGRGLGLAIVADLARQEGFGFELEARPGGGTLARLAVRRAQEAA